MIKGGRARHLARAHYFSAPLEVFHAYIFIFSVSWNVPVVIIIPFLVFTGRSVVITAGLPQCLLGYHNAPCVWLSASIALCVGWSE